LSLILTAKVTLPVVSNLFLNIPVIKLVLPDLEPGNFTVLHGSRGVSYLASVLCVRAQFPSQVGGLASQAVFIDGGNTFQLYQVTRLAQLYGLEPTRVLKQIQIARAFTAYQLTSLIMDKLAEAVQATEAKLVVVSDIAGLFLDEAIADEEAQAIYRQVINYLVEFTKQRRLIVVATCLPHIQTERGKALQALTLANAHVAGSIVSADHRRYFLLEKHPRYKLGSAEFNSAHPTLPEFFGVPTNGQNC
jgi:hypothetical protein